MFDGAFTDLTFIWAWLIAFAVFAYVVLDGFDLGLGILFGVMPDRRDRDVMMNTVAPVWDGNETWLILGGGGLFAAFPLAYALILPALYMPIMIMLLALIFRGVAFEFRWRSRNNRGVWDWAFIGGSSLAAFCQGLTLGALLQGIEVNEATRSYAGGWWDWLTPFSITCGLAVMAGYCLLGATWLVMKTTGPLQASMRSYGWAFGVITIAFIALVSLWTPFLQEGYYHRWFEGQGIYVAFAVGAAVIAVGAGLFWSLVHREHEHLPFLLSLTLFALCFVGLGVCMWPYAVPTSVTIWEAAAPPLSQAFMLVGALILLPCILGYTAYTYWVFRGKLKPGEGYH